MWIYEPTPEEIAHPKECRSCGAKIVWAITQASKATPLNADFKIIRRQAVTLQTGERSELAEVKRGSSHFSTCPQKNQWRKRK